MQVAAIMSRSPVTVDVHTGVEAALRLARRKQIQHLLVFEGEQLVGVACLCDLERARGDADLASVMHSPVVRLDAGAKTREAAELMRELGIGCLPVVAGGLLLGIVTRTDLARAGLKPDELARPCTSCGGRGHLESMEDGATFCRDCVDCVRCASEPALGAGD